MALTVNMGKGRLVEEGKISNSRVRRNSVRVRRSSVGMRRSSVRVRRSSDRMRRTVAQMVVCRLAVRQGRVRIPTHQSPPHGDSAHIADSSEEKEMGLGKYL